MRKHDENLLDESVLFIEPFFETERKSKIVTKNGVFYSRYTAVELINKACMRYASTYEGRVKATRLLLDQHQKTTILISTDGVVAAYPTRSPAHPECVWLFNQQYRLEKLSANSTRVIYDAYGISVDINVSAHTLKKQKSRMFEMLYFYVNKVR